MAKKQRYPKTIESAVVTEKNGTLKERLKVLDADLALKAPIANPAFTGMPTTPTPVESANDTQVANTQFVKVHIASRAPVNSPQLNGIPTAPTASVGTNSTQIATTAFVQTEVNSKIAASDAMIYKGTLGTGGTITALPASHTTGWTYKVITAGTYAAQKCEIGDMIICLTTGTTATDAHWTVVQTNIDGAVIGPDSAVADRIAVFNGATGKILKDGGVTLSQLVQTSRKVTAGSGLTGGGVLSADITLSHQVKPTTGSDAGGSGSVVTGVTVDTMGHVVSTTKGNITSVTGNAGTATKLQTAHRISIEGPRFLTASKTFDGSSDISVLLNSRMCIDMCSASDSDFVAQQYGMCYMRLTGGMLSSIKVNTVHVSSTEVGSGTNLDLWNGRIELYMSTDFTIPVDLSKQKHDEGLNTVWVGNFTYNNVEYSVLAHETEYNSLRMIFFKNRGATNELPDIPIGWPQSSLKEAVGLGFEYYDETTGITYQLDKNFDWLYEEFVTV